MQAELLPQCDVVFISGTTMINHTTDKIIKMCTKAREISLLGFSVPFYPEAYEDSGLSNISGVEFKKDCKEILFKKNINGLWKINNASIYPWSFLQNQQLNLNKDDFSRPRLFRSK